MKTYPVGFGRVTRELPIVEVAPGVSVALLNMLGDTELTEEAGRLLAERLPADVDVLVTPEVKAVPLAHVISRISGRPYVVARKTNKPYMVDPIVREVVSITTGKPQLLVIDGADIDKVRGRNAAIIDDVVSTGGTVRSLTALIGDVGGKVTTTMAVFTEGDEWPDVIALGHLPLFGGEG
ncbi:MAG TPA: phosphoribosyltransferase family protein [Deinococcales bacterium]|nr:phosphoribosyltransferase family protein [Deinococcales bacterium]